jgi:Mg2+/citrate symporter
MDPNVLWMRILPVQFFGMVLLFGACFILAWEEKKKGFFTPMPESAATLKKLFPAVAIRNRR